MKSKGLLATIWISGLTLAAIVLLIAPLSGAVLSQSSAAIVNDVSWNRDGTLLASGRDDGTVEIISRTGQPSFTFSVYNFALTSVSWSPIEDNKLAIGSRDGTIRLLDLNGGQFNVALEFPSNKEFARKVEWSPNGTYLASIESSGSGVGLASEVNIWDASSGTLVQTYTDGYDLTDIAWNPQNSNLLLLTGVANDQGAEIVLWDAINNTVMWTALQPDDGVTSIAWNLDGNMFATMTEGVSDETYGTAFVRIHDGTTGNLILTLPTSMSFRGAIAWTPSQRLAVSDRRTIQIWDPTTSQIVESFQPTNPVNTISWSPDGSNLAYGGIGGIVEVAELTQPPTATPTPSILT